MKKTAVIAFLLCLGTLGLVPRVGAEVRKIPISTKDVVDTAMETGKIVGKMADQVDKIKEESQAILPDKTGSKPVEDTGNTVNIMADHLEQVKKENTIIGTGKVKIKYQEMRVAADRIEINTESGDGTARGNVVIIDEANGHKIHCKFSTFNIHNKKATIYNSEGVLSTEFYFHGRKVERKSEKRYVINEGDITSCFGDNPAWKFKCSKVDARMKDYAILHDPTFMIKGRPFFYLPWGYVPLDTDRTTGILIPEFGQSDEDGTFFNNKFFWAINDQWDATFGLDYLSKRGIRPNAELRYFTSQTTKGEFYGDFIKDWETNDLYWKLFFDHRQKFDNGIDMVANIEWIEGMDYDKIHSNSVLERTRRETDNYVTLTKNWENKSIFFQSRYHKSLETFNRNESGVLPQISYRQLPQKLGRLPLYFELDTSYSDFAMKTSGATPVKFTQRVDFHPQVSMPINRWPWLTLTPKIGFRETLYDHGRQDSLVNYDKAIFRTAYNFDTVLEGPKFTKTFMSEGNETAYKHLIEPRVTHSYVPDVGDQKDKIVISDGLDILQETHYVNYSLTNRLFKKEMRSHSGGAAELVRFEINQSYSLIDRSNLSSMFSPLGFASTYNYNALAGGVFPWLRPFSDLRFDFDSRPTRKLMFNFDGTYSVYDNLLNTFNTEVVLKPTEAIGLYLERRFTRNFTTDILGSMRWKLSSKWELDYTARFDEKTGDFRESNASLGYHAQCWGVTMDLIQRKNYFMGEKFEDTRFLFQVNLKGLGSYGSKKDTTLHRRF